MFHKIKLIFLIVLLSAAPVYAYSDPGSGLLILQMLGSALVGILFYFSKIKNWILSKLSKNNVPK